MLAALSLAACSQSRGDPCQVTSDCGSGLVCCSAEDTPRGMCMQGDTCPESVAVDAGRPDDNSDDDDAG